MVINDKASGFKAINEPTGPSESVGREGWSRDCLLGAARWGFDSPHVQSQLTPVSGCRRLRGMSSGMSQGQGCKPTVILALRPEESKGQNDVFKLLPSW